MLAPSPAWAWDEHKVLDYILEHHPVLQAQRDAHSAEKLLNRLPVIETLLNERSQAAANWAVAEAQAARLREVATARTEAAETALAQATSEPQRTRAEKEWRGARKAQEADFENVDAALEKARVAAEYEDYSSQRRSALAELGQLRRRLAEKATRRLDEESKAGEVRQTALGDLAKLRELEAERAAAETRQSFLKSKSAWLQQQIAQGQPETDLWENAKQQTAETAALKRLDLLIESQRQQVAHLAGDRWQWLYRYLSGVGR